MNSHVDKRKLSIRPLSHAHTHAYTCRHAHAHAYTHAPTHIGKGFGEEHLDIESRKAWYNVLDQAWQWANITAIHTFGHTIRVCGGGGGGGGGAKQSFRHATTCIHTSEPGACVCGRDMQILYV